MSTLTCYKENRGMIDAIACTAKDYYFDLLLLRILRYVKVCMLLLEKSNLRSICASR